MPLSIVIVPHITQRDQKQVGGGGEGGLLKNTEKISLKQNLKSLSYNAFKFCIVFY